MKREEFFLIMLKHSILTLYPKWDRSKDKKNHRKIISKLISLGNKMFYIGEKRYKYKILM